MASHSTVDISVTFAPNVSDLRKELYSIADRQKCLGALQLIREDYTDYHFKYNAFYRKNCRQRMKTSARFWRDIKRLNVLRFFEYFCTIEIAMLWICLKCLRRGTWITMLILQVRIFWSSKRALFYRSRIWQASVFLNVKVRISLKVWYRPLISSAIWLFDTLWSSLINCRTGAGVRTSRKWGFQLEEKRLCMFDISCE